MKALITGATSGIGKEIAINLSKKGIDLVLASRNLQKMNDIKNELSKYVNVDIFEVDLSIAGTAAKLYRDVSDAGHIIDILVNNAGFGLFGRTDEFDHNLLEEMLVLNSVSLTTLCRLFAKDMIDRQNGFILNVSSTAAFQPIPFFGAYSASKSYVLNFSKALHHELKHYGVVVTSLHPGPTDTNFFEVALSGKRFPAFKGKPMMTAAEVAETGINAMFERRSVVIAGVTNIIFRRILPIIPLSIVGWFLRSVKAKI